MSNQSPTGLADPTEVGSYFVANYPPFSVWTSEAVARDAMPALRTAPGNLANPENLANLGNPGNLANPVPPLGLYLHIPFCRKRCHFCYFRVYTDKNAQ